MITMNTPAIIFKIPGKTEKFLHQWFPTSIPRSPSKIRFPCREITRPRLYKTADRNAPNLLSSFPALQNALGQIDAPHMAMQCTEVRSPMQKQHPYPIPVSASSLGTSKFRMPECCSIR